MASLSRWKLPKSRSGRRPISVMKMLQREAEGVLFKKHGYKLDQPQLLAESRNENLPTGISMGIDSGHQPSLRLQKEVLAGVSHGGFLVRGAVELNRDLLAKVGQVDVVAPNRVVQDHVHAQTQEPLVKKAFESADGLHPLSCPGDVLIPPIGSFGTGPHGVALSPEALFHGGDTTSKLGSHLGGTETSLVELNHSCSGYLQSTHVSVVPSPYGYIKTAEAKKYKLQDSLKFQGLDVAVENKPGSVRSGKNEDGTSWHTRFSSPYGYIRKTEGADGEELDCYVGPKRDADTAFVVHQKKDDGGYDEDTVMLGYDSKSSAKADILRHYDDPRYVGTIDAVPMARLHALIDKGKKLTKISSITPPTHDFDYADPETGTMGIPAKLPKKRLEMPARDEVDITPKPTAEHRMDSRGSLIVGELGTPGGFEDVGKTSMNDTIHRAMETLGELSRSWEVPSNDESMTGGAEKLDHHGPIGLTISEVGPPSADPLEGTGIGSDVGGRITKSASVFVSFVRELSTLNAVTPHQLEKVAEVTRDQAQEALAKLDELDRQRPTLGQLGRGALVGSVVGPIASNVNKLISTGHLKTPREMAGDLAGGAIFGIATPLIKHRVESGTERHVLRDYMNQGHGGRLATQIESKLETP